jgi:hypothetical protein
LDTHRFEPARARRRRRGEGRRGGRRRGRVPWAWPPPPLLCSALLLSRRSLLAFLSVLFSLGVWDGWGRRRTEGRAHRLDYTPLILLPTSSFLTFYCVLNFPNFYYAVNHVFVRASYITIFFVTGKAPEGPRCQVGSLPVDREDG